MRDVEKARKCFQGLQLVGSLQELKTAVRLDGSSPSIANEGCRSACWKAFLLFESLDIALWLRTLSSSRSAYNSIRAHFLRPLENQDEVDPGFDPLSDDTDASPWAQLRRDEDLRAEILQDVTRCMPENLYFRQPDTQRMLLDILFVFCKLNPDVSYRQGMHELLAPVLWVVERDAIDPGQNSKVMGEDAATTAIFDAAHIEHDTFALFGQIMQSAKNFYEQTTTSGTENPIVARSRWIFNELLPRVDERLAKHLDDIEIVPQVFLMRWIRLLFGREFAFDQTLMMWDAIFAEDPTLDIVNEICLTMLLRIRWELLEADYNAALAILLRYPEIDSDFSAQTLVVDALYLRNHMDYHGGSFLVSKYTGRPLYQPGRSTTPPVLQRNQTVVSGTSLRNKTPRSVNSPPSYASTSARDINNVIQSTAKGLYARGEKLGIGKAVRTAVDEVHKRAQEIRDAPTPSATVVRHQRQSRSSFGPDPRLDSFKVLEERNKGLAKLLDGAISDLWAYQKTITETQEPNQRRLRETDIERLSAAIAKVQFVQVYLDDSSLDLPNTIIGENENSKGEAGEKRPNSNAGVEEAAVMDPLQASSIDEASDKIRNHALPPSSRDFSSGQQDKPMPAKPLSVLSATTERIDKSSPVTGSTSHPSDLQNNASTRPRLEQSSFSWMLGERDATSASAKAPAFAASRPRKQGYLFGDEAE